MILGVTPVRAGSKSVPGKNIRALCGRPLLAWTVEAARASRLIDRYVVSTESGDLARVAGELGVEVLDRPAALASDETLTVAVLQHVLEHIPADFIVLLQATSPIRGDGLIDRCIRRVLDVRADSLATGYICRLREYGAEQRRRQDVGGFFTDDGNVYVVSADLVRAGSLCGARPERMIIDREQNIEIDDEFDFWIAEQILERRQGVRACR